MTLFLLILACSAGILLVLWYIYRTAFYNPPSMRGTIDDPMKGDQYEDVAEHIYRISHIMEKASCEEIQITSFDGCKLFGRYYHLRDGAPLEILFHGYRSCSFRDCSGGHLLSRKMGFNALVIDQRAHGKSSGNTITFGVKEHRDCKMWIDYAVRRFGTDCPIMLSGISMGAATVLMAAGLELPENGFEGIKMTVPSELVPRCPVCGKPKEEGCTCEVPQWKDPRLSVFDQLTTDDE